MIADKLARTPQQVLLKWGIQSGWSVIPKTVSEKRVKENFDLDGWEIPAKDLTALHNLSNRFKVCDDEWLPVKVFHGDDE